MFVLCLSSQSTKKVPEKKTISKLTLLKSIGRSKIDDTMYCYFFVIIYFKNKQINETIQLRVRYT